MPGVVVVVVVIIFVVLLETFSMHLPMHSRHTRRHPRQILIFTLILTRTTTNDNHMQLYGRNEKSRLLSKLLQKRVRCEVAGS